MAKQGPTKSLNRLWDWIGENRLQRSLFPVLLVAICLGVYTFEARLSVIGDNAQYVVLARSLASGQGYRQINEPLPTVHTKYPPGFPLILAASEILIPGNIMAMKILVFILFPAALVVLFFLFRDRVPGRWLGPLLLLIAVNPEL